MLKEDDSLLRADDTLDEQHEDDDISIDTMQLKQPVLSTPVDSASDPASQFVTKWAASLLAVHKAAV